MAKLIKLNPTNKKEKKSEEPISLEDFISVLKEMNKEIDKLTRYDKAEDKSHQEKTDDVFGMEEEDNLSVISFPKNKFLGKSTREFHIRIKLNNAPVNIWRELIVPSNISLELLAFVLISAMGWEHRHLYQFKRGEECYVNSYQQKELGDYLTMSISRVKYLSSENTSLEMLLQPKDKRIKFEYDFGDSWEHDVWVKGARDYATGEEPVVKLLKAQGMCPPEDCGGVWGYAKLLELSKKKRKSFEDKERLEWYFIDKDYDPEYCDLEWLQEDVESLWSEIKKEM